MASDELVVLYSDGEEESCDELASKYALNHNASKTNKEERPKYIWTVEKISALIDLWSKAPLLFDTKDFLYFNKVERERAIANIAKDLGVSVNDVLGKMYSLRTYYSKQQGMIQTSINKGADDVYSPRWQWYESLSFLCDHMRAKPRAVPVKPSNLSQATGKTLNPSPVKEPVVIKTVPERATSETHELLNKPLKKARLSNEGEMLNTAIQVLKKPSQTDQSKTDDMLWAEQMGRAIQKIEDEELKEWLKLEIQQMITRTRFNKPRGSFNTEFNSSRVPFQSLTSLPTSTPERDSETSGNED
jgi:hypothetical protein